MSQKNPDDELVEAQLVLAKQEQLKQLEEQVYIKENLPHLPGPDGLGCNAHGLYQWQEDMIRGTKKKNGKPNHLGVTTCGNQAGKSTALILRMIRWATDKPLWPKLWGDHRPTQFWYYYPDFETASVEFETKIKKVYLPRGRFKTDPVYGWSSEKKKGEIRAIHFNSGVSCYFRSYAQNVLHTQASTVSLLIFDEEAPEENYNEAIHRINAAGKDGGYVMGAWTCTRNVEMWRRTMMRIGKSDEMFPKAFKQAITLYDCLTYTDGSPSTIWTEEKIELKKESMTSQAEIDRRIYGLYVPSSGLEYSSFSRKRNYKPYHPINPNSGWMYYAGVDWGSGNPGTGHPSAITIIAVDPLFKRGRVVKFKKFDGIPTTQGDLVQHYMEMTSGMTITQGWYDYAASDFGEICTRKGIPISKANKSKEHGKGILNSLFRTGQLIIYESPEAEKLCIELENFTGARKVHDDGIDSLRYGTSSIPWNIDFNHVPEKESLRDVIKEIKEKKPMTMRERMYHDDWEGYEDDTPIDELEAAQDMFEMEGYDEF